MTAGSCSSSLSIRQMLVMSIARRSWIAVELGRGCSTSLLAETANQNSEIWEVKFDFSEKISAATMASDVADALWEHPSQPVAGPALVGPYSGRRDAVLEALVPENCVVFDVARHDDAELVSGSDAGPHECFGRKP